MGKSAIIKQTAKTKIINKQTMKKLPLFIFVLSILSPLVLAPAAYADSYNDRIRALRQQNKQSVVAQDKLEASAEKLETKIANLKTSIKELNDLILENQSKRQQLKRDIVKSEADIEYQRTLMADNIKRMYLDGEFSTFEKLASSKDLSEYVDKEQYRVNLQNRIKETTAHITELKRRLEEQKVLTEKLLSDQKAMQLHLGTEKKELDRLLKLNKAQQAQYDKDIAKNTSRITDLQRQQAEENARFLREQAAKVEAARKEAARRKAEAAARERAESSRQGAVERPSSVAPAAAQSSVRYVNGHNYPWKYVYFPNTLADTWGMYKRQCVSYTAWKVAQSGRHMPYWGGRGNAKLWDDNARRAGIPVDGNPRVGDVAVSNRGYYGHVMYVEAVHDDGTITISQYNAGWDGRYSEATIYPGDLVFIHF
jgi:surface antigen